jgi:hypothetical protein
MPNGPAVRSMAGRTRREAEEPQPEIHAHSSRNPRLRARVPARTIAKPVPGLSLAGSRCCRQSRLARRLHECGEPDFGIGREIERNPAHGSPCERHRSPSGGSRQPSCPLQESSKVTSTRGMAASKALVARGNEDFRIRTFRGCRHDPERPARAMSDSRPGGGTDTASRNRL